MGLIEDIQTGKVDEIELLENVTSNDINVALAVATSTMATKPVLDIAAHDADKRVRIAALRNRNTGDETILFLCSDSDIEISELAKQEWERRKR